MQEHRTLMIHMTDLHDGKKTKSFDMDVLQDRMSGLSERLLKMSDWMPFVIDKVVIMVTGDVVDGAAVYPTQSSHVNEDDVLEQIDHTADLLFVFALEQHEIWNCPVELQCVAGNHGRVGRFHNENTNWDIVVYKTAQTLSRIHTDVDVEYGGNGESKFLRSFEVYKTGILLYHGHGIRMYQSIPRYGIVQRIMRWSTAKSLGEWRYLFLGHFHRCEHFSQNDINCYISGTMVTNDDWALETLGYDSDPHWWVMLMSTDGSITENFKLPLA